MLQRYEEQKQQAVKAERHMLRAFGFVLHVEHPHRFVLNYCQMLECGWVQSNGFFSIASCCFRSVTTMHSLFRL
jgi:hypothetical protein